MTQRELRIVIAASIATLAVLAFALPLAAQAPRRDTLGTRVRDSLLAAVLADTLDDDLAPDTTQLTPALHTLRQTVTLRPTVRRYSVGDVSAGEQSSYVGWVAKFPRATLRLSVTPVTYAGDTSSRAAPPEVSFGGASPLSARLDVPLRTADTLRVFAQTMSFPGTLAAAETQALGTVGTSTLDLDAGALGVTARAGVRYVVSQAIGGSGVLLSARGGVEYEPRPSGAQVVSWRGTTLRGGLAISRATTAGSVGAAVDVSHSVADSLGGRNLFPGGGSLDVDLRGTRWFGAEGDGFVSLNGFYSKPMGLERPDVPTRIIPVGDFTGVTVAASVPVGRAALLPTLSVLRESSHASAVVNTRTITLDASGQTTTLSLGLSLPLGRAITVTPEIGGAFGSVGQTVSAQFPRRVRSKTFSDAISGGWAALEFAIAR